MSDVKHTPGPWRQGTFSGHTANTVFAQNDDAVCQVYGIPFHQAVSDITDARWAEGMANARLIAAAPEMYGALKAAHKTLQLASRQLSEDHKLVLSGRGWGWRELATIDAAIAKAEGRQP